MVPGHVLVGGQQRYSGVVGDRRQVGDGFAVALDHHRRMPGLRGLPDQVRCLGAGRPQAHGQQHGVAHRRQRRPRFVDQHTGDRRISPGRRGRQVQRRRPERIRGPGRGRGSASGTSPPLACSTAHCGNSLAIRPKKTRTPALTLATHAIQRDCSWKGADDELSSRRAPPKLRREVGLVPLFMVSAGSVIGSGWLLGTLNASEVAGPAAIVSWIIGAILLIGIALVYAELGVRVPDIRRHRPVHLDPRGHARRVLLRDLLLPAGRCHRPDRGGGVDRVHEREMVAWPGELPIAAHRQGPGGRRGGDVPVHGAEPAGRAGGWPRATRSRWCGRSSSRWRRSS